LCVYLQLKDKMFDIEYKDQLVEWLNDDEKLICKAKFCFILDQNNHFLKTKVIFLLHFTCFVFEIQT
jgi:hypothetical protein